MFALACILPPLAQAASSLDRSPPVATNTPRSRVVIVQDSEATDAFRPRAEIVHTLVQRGLLKFTGQSNAPMAWRSLVSTQDTVGIKVVSSPGPQVGSRPEVVAPIVEGLLSAGIPAKRIVIWDRQLSDLRLAGFDELARRFGVRLAGALESGWDESAFYDFALIGQPLFGDLEFQKKGDGVGRKSYVSKLLTKEITKIISVAPMLNHNSVGVCGNLYSLAMSSVDNTLRFEGETARLSQAVPEIFALEQLSDRVVLNIVDALVCQYEGEQIGRLHNSAALNQLRFSADPVALDILSIEEIATQRQRAEIVPALHTNQLQLYRNAMLLELGVTDPKKIDLELFREPR